MYRHEFRGMAAAASGKRDCRPGAWTAASITTRNIEMKPDTPISTPGEKKFDQAQEEAFSNEGAPPPAGAAAAAANADRLHDDEASPGARSLRSLSPEDPVSARALANETESDGPPLERQAKDAAHARPGDGQAVASVCSLLTARLPGRGS
jgi:hypothetical protein